MTGNGKTKAALLAMACSILSSCHGMQDRETTSSRDLHASSLVVDLTLESDGRPFEGEVQGKFLISRGRNTVWSNDGTGSFADAPDTGIALRVVDGRLRVELGAPRTPPLPAEVTSSSSGFLLHTWLDAGTGFHKLDASIPVAQESTASGSRPAAGSDLVRSEAVVEAKRERKRAKLAGGTAGAEPTGATGAKAWQQYRYEMRGGSTGGRTASRLMRAKDHLDRMYRPVAGRGIMESSGLWSWQWLGPGNIGGRVRTIVIHPTMPDTMWIGAASGGIWKTTDGGQSWSPQDDFMANLTVTSIAMDAADPDTLYAATGEASFTGSSGNMPGGGIFITRNGGDDWDLLEATDPEGNDDFEFVSRLAADPVTSGVVFAATGSGRLFRSDNFGLPDGAMQDSWVEVLDTRQTYFYPFTGQRNVAPGLLDVKINPENANEILVGTGRNHEPVEAEVLTMQDGGPGQDEIQRIEFFPTFYQGIDRGPVRGFFYLRYKGTPSSVSLPWSLFGDTEVEIANALGAEMAAMLTDDLGVGGTEPSITGNYVDGIDITFDGAGTQGLDLEEFEVVTTYSNSDLDLLINVGADAWYTSTGGMRQADWEILTTAQFLNDTGAPTGDGERYEVAFGTGSVGETWIYLAKGDRNHDPETVEEHEGALWLSRDAGATWDLQNEAGWMGDQGSYNNAIWVDPGDSEHVVVGGIDAWRSTSAGVAPLQQISDWEKYMPNGLSAHADHHAIVSHPGFGATNQTVFFGNDGGIQRADDISMAGTTTGWTNLANGLGITQFYGGAASPDGSVVIGGTQDNSTVVYTPSGGSSGWTQPHTGDGGYCAVDYDNPQIMYWETQNQRVRKSTDGGASASLAINGLTDAGNKDDAPGVAPLVMDPVDSSVLYSGSKSLWRTTNGASNWSEIRGRVADVEVTGGGISFTAGSVPQMLPDLIEDAAGGFVAAGFSSGDTLQVYSESGTNDGEYIVSAVAPGTLTLDTMGSLTTQDSNTAGFTRIVRLGDNPFISAIAVSKTDPNVIWIGYRDGRLSVTTDGAAGVGSWTDVDVTTQLPFFPGSRAHFILAGFLPKSAPAVTSLTIHPYDHDEIVVTFGRDQVNRVWATTDGGVTWEPRSGPVVQEESFLEPGAVGGDPPVHSIILEFNDTNPDEIEGQGDVDFVALGFEAGTTVTVANSDNDGIYLIESVTSNILRLDPGATLSADNSSRTTLIGQFGMPELQVNTVVHHPAMPNWLYAGLDLGILASEDGGLTWGLMPLQPDTGQGFPHSGPANVEVDQLFWQGGEKLLAATHGRGMWRASPFSVLYVDKAYVGVSEGTFEKPYKSVQDALDDLTVPPGTVIAMKGNTYGEAPLGVITKPLILRALGGTVTIQK
jgi:hypothetical protein